MFHNILSVMNVLFKLKTKLIFVTFVIFQAPFPAFAFAKSFQNSFENLVDQAKGTKWWRVCVCVGGLVFIMLNQNISLG